jgi:flavin reductase (DIM6/NTAB) family NADH-FMN oxidoreductase RutF
MRHNGRVTSPRNPFAPPIEEREPLRRFRGRLAAPVTIVTAGSRSRRAGLTVSSLFVIEGEPGRIHLVVGPVSDLWDVAEETGHCVVHIAHGRHRGIADVFAGLRPSPGGPFAAVETTESEWGPVIADMPDRAYCRTLSLSELGWSGVIETEVERVELSEGSQPLIHHRGGYHGLGENL